MTTKAQGELIRRLRRDAGYTQIRLAEELGYDQSTLSKVEAGRRQAPHETIEKIAQVLKLDDERRRELIASGRPRPPDDAPSDESPSSNNWYPRYGRFSRLLFTMTSGFLPACLLIIFSTIRYYLEGQIISVSRLWEVVLRGENYTLYISITAFILSLPFFSIIFGLFCERLYLYFFWTMGIRSTELGSIGPEKTLIYLQRTYAIDFDKCFGISFSERTTGVSRRFLNIFSILSESSRINSLNNFRLLRLIWNDALFRSKSEIAERVVGRLHVRYMTYGTAIFSTICGYIIWILYELSVHQERIIVFYIPIIVAFAINTVITYGILRMLISLRALAGTDWIDATRMYIDRIYGHFGPPLPTKVARATRR